MGKEQMRKPYLVDEHGRISLWLRNDEHHEYEEGMSEFGDDTTVIPITPSRRPSLPISYEETSPTNTSFSEDPVFDTPRFLSDGWVEDVFYDDFSDETPGEVVDEPNDRALHDCCDVDCFEVEGHTSYGLSNEVINGVEEDQDKNLMEGIETTIDPDRPQPTWLTSCAQCIYANLPCSRKAPACSRCRRKGQATVCLLYRRLYPEEILNSDASWSTTLKLLKLSDEDEEHWEKKLRLAEELHASWRAGNESRNWVFPPVESPQGKFRSKAARAEQQYPGEGLSESKSRFSYQELCVTLGD